MLKDLLLWLYWYPFRFFIQAMPVSCLYGIGRIGGIVLFHIFTRKRRLFEEKLNKIFCRSLDCLTSTKITRDAFIVFFQNELEVLIFSKLNSENIESVVKVSGLENLDKASAQGSGVMLLFAHFGANQMIMPAIGYRGYKMSQLSAPPMVWVEKMPRRKFSRMGRKALDLRWLQELSLPVKHINIFGSLKEAFLCLKKNEILGIAVDGGGGKDRVAIDFLGRKALFSTGAIEIAIRTGCAVLPVFMLRDKKGHNTMVIEPRMEISKEDEVRCNLYRFVERLQWYVIKYPHLYLNFLALRQFMSEQGDTPFFLAEEINNNENSIDKTSVFTA